VTLAGTKPSFNVEAATNAQGIITVQASSDDFLLIDTKVTVKLKLYRLDATVKEGSVDYSKPFNVLFAGTVNGDPRFNLFPEDHTCKAFRSPE